MHCILSVQSLNKPSGKQFKPFVDETLPQLPHSILSLSKKLVALCDVLPSIIKWSLEGNREVIIKWYLFYNCELMPEFLLNSHLTAVHIHTTDY